MSDRYPLGKPIRPAPEPAIDVIEHMGNGVIKRNGKMETIRPLPPGPPDPYQHMLDILRRQQADGFPLNEFGVM